MKAASYLLCLVLALFPAFVGTTQAFADSVRNALATNPPVRGVSVVTTSHTSCNHKVLVREERTWQLFAATPFADEMFAAVDSTSLPTPTRAASDSAKQTPATTSTARDSTQAFSFTKILKWIEAHAVLAGAILALVALIWKLTTGESHLPRLRAWLTRRKWRRHYLQQLKAEHERIHLLGFQAETNIPARTLEVFVSLRLAEANYANMREAHFAHESNRVLSPEQTLQRAFFGASTTRLLLILGDPGSGKTTLLKYYAMCCLDQSGRKQLGLPQPLLPIFVPLRKIDPQKTFCEALSEAVSNRNHPIPPEAFKPWLERGSLVLLDGLDELSTVAQRQQACKWIDEAVAAYRASRFIVTSRFTGYRASDDVELRTPHKRGEVLDLDSAQQEAFLKKWFAAAYRESEETASANKAEQARQVANAVRDYLQQPENESLRKLAGTPVLLQIMAILWKEYGTLVSGRAGLYEKCTDYLLDRRDRVRDLPPPLPAEQAKIVLRPLALFMQETLKTHDIGAEELAARIERTLEEVKPGLKPETFIEHLRDRAALLKAFGDNRYVFSHNSFREFLAAGELAEQIKRNPERSRVLVDNFTEGWWRETILFCLSLPKPVIFAEFFERFLPHPNNAPGFPELLRHGIREALHKPIAPFEAFLLERAQEEAKRYSALLCLRAIASEPAKALVQKVWEQEEPNQIKQKAEELLLEWKFTRQAAEALPASTTSDRKNFHNPIELNAEYILLPGGKYKYSVTEKEVEVPPIYFAKYPVTNKLYRRFVAGMEQGAWGRGLGAKGMEQRAWAKGHGAGDMAQGIGGELTLAQFAESLLREAKKITGFVEYLGKDHAQWADKLRSKHDDDKRFNDDEQPVVGVTWFDAVSYCHWLNEMQRAMGKEQGANNMFRLPTEEEWEWAASGDERKFPWGNEPPDEKRANYGQKVGQTTPVGSYPDGATPEGLLDMAGNVWEWNENLFGHKEYPEARALRGGSWDLTSVLLRCAARDFLHPDLRWFRYGFRLVAGQSHFLRL